MSTQAEPLKANYKWDRNLKITPAEKSSWIKCKDDDEEINSETHSYPFLKTFIMAAKKAYKSIREEKSTSNNIDDKKSIENNLIYMQNQAKLLNNLEESSTEQVHRDFQNNFCNESFQSKVDEDFQFLCEASNSKFTNGYFGVAYICARKRQIILSHRGTSNWGAVGADITGVWWGSYTRQVSSAMTFAEIIAQYARENNCQVFYTGHSLGAWLAQITCFSTKYLMLRDKYFIAKSPQNWDDIHPYTVGFDSPGAKEFLQYLKRGLFQTNEPQQQKINVSCLPVEVYLFSANLVNTVNDQVGVVFLVDLKKDEVKSYWKPLQSHKMEFAVKKICENSEANEENVLKGRVLDWRISNWTVFLQKWDLTELCVPVELAKFPEYLLSEKEFNVIREEMKRIKRGENGAYEGFLYADESVAATITGLMRNEGLVFKDGSILVEIVDEETSENQPMDRREAIPILRRFVELILESRIWFNPTKPQLPDFFIRRQIQRVDIMTRVNGTHYIEKAVLYPYERLVLISGPPGMGKTCLLTKLDSDLRAKTAGTRRSIFRINLNMVTEQLDSLESRGNFAEDIPSFITRFVRYFPKESVNRVICNPLYILLDGLDEVLPEYERAMMDKILSLLLSPNNPQCRVVLTTRIHLKKLVEEKFGTTAYSLVPLTFHEQLRVVQKVCKVNTEEAEKYVIQLPLRMQDLLQIPLMLRMFAEVINIADRSAETLVLDVPELYLRFLNEKHKVYVIEKTGADPHNKNTKKVLRSILKENIPFYNTIAVKQLCGEKIVKEILAADEENSIFEFPKEEERITLLDIGVVQESNVSEVKFKHRSFAEYFYAKMITDKENVPVRIRNILFAVGYKAGENVAEFVMNMVKNEPFSNFITEEWTKWIPESSKIETYSGSSPTQLDQLLTNLVNYSGCSGARKFLVKQTYNSLEERTKGIYRFFDWLQSKSPGWVRENIFHIQETGQVCSNMKEFIAAVACSGDAAIISQLMNYITESEIKIAMKECSYLIEIAVGWKYNEQESDKIYSSELQKRSARWMSKDELGNYIRQWIGFQHKNKELFFEIMSRNFELSCLIDSVLSDEEMFCLFTNEETRLSDVVGICMENIRICWGDKLIPERLLQFRFMFTGVYPEDCEENESELNWNVNQTTVRRKLLPKKHSICKPATRLTLEEYEGTISSKRGYLDSTISYRDEEKYKEQKRKKIRKVPKEELLGRSLFHGEFIPENLLDGDKLWDEIENNLNDAVRVILDDGDFSLIWKLEESIERLAVKARHFHTSSSRSEIISRRIKLVRNILEKVNNEEISINNGIVGEDLCYLIAYKRLSSEKEWEELLRVNKLQLFHWYQFDDVAKCLVLSAGKAEKQSFRGKKGVPAPFHLVKLWIQNAIVGIDVTQNMVNVLLSFSQNEFAQVARNLNLAEDHALILETPSFWEMFYISELLPLERTDWIEIVKGFFESSEKNSFCCCSVQTFLQKLKEMVEGQTGTNGGDLFKEVLNSGVLSSFPSSARRLWVVNRESAICYIKGVVDFYLDTFGENFRNNLSVLDLIKTIPVGMIVVSERFECWNELLEAMRERQREFHRNWDCSNKLSYLYTLELNYNRECDWYTFLKNFSTVSDKVPQHSPDHEKVYGDWKCCFLRSWINVFGEEQTRLEAEEAGASNKFFSFWKYAAKNVKDGELLQIAVELGSLIGVKYLTWPATLKWKNESGKNAIAFSKEKWGDGHEITQFLQSFSE